MKFTEPLNSIFRPPKLTRTRIGFALAAAVWQREDRGLILSLVTLGYLAGAAVLAYVASRRLRNWSPFAETCRQFHADCECLHDVIATATR